MDRLTFLSSMLGNAALLTVPPWELLPAEAQDRLAWTKDALRVFVFDCHVRGFKHYEGRTVLPHMRDLDPLDLVREYDNAYDANAVAIYWEGQKVGFLPMGENVSLAYMMDHGLLLECHVVCTAPDAPPWEQCFVAVQLLMPHTPAFSAYLEHYMDRPDAGYKRRPEYAGPDELIEEPVFATAAHRELRQAAALQALGQLRFIRLVAHLRALPDWHPFALEQIHMDVEKWGLRRLHALLSNGELRLNVTVVASDHFLVDLGMRGPEGWTGGHWEVVYNATHKVVRTDMRGGAMA